MRMNIAVEWNSAPLRGRLTMTGGTVVDGTTMLGWGTHERGVFTFNDKGPAKICLAIEIPGRKPSLSGVRLNLVDSDVPPVSIPLDQVLANDPLVLPEHGMRIFAEEDRWSSL